MKLKLHIDGMTCNGCVSNIINMISKFNGVKKVNVNLDSKSADLDINRNQFNTDDFITKINETKFNVKIIEENITENKSTIFNKIANLF